MNDKTNRTTVTRSEAHTSTMRYRGPRACERAMRCSWAVAEFAAGFKDARGAPDLMAVVFMYARLRLLERKRLQKRLEIRLLPLDNFRRSRQFEKPGASIGVRQDGAQNPILSGRRVGAG